MIHLHENKQEEMDMYTNTVVSFALHLISCGGHVASVARPVCVDEFPGVRQELICMGTKVIPLSLKTNRELWSVDHDKRA